MIKDIETRAKQSCLNYFGAATPTEAQFIKSNQAPAFIVDVRTRAEWAYVGLVPGSIQIE